MKSRFHEIRNCKRGWYMVLLVDSQCSSYVAIKRRWSWVLWDAAKDAVNRVAKRLANAAQLESMAMGAYVEVS